MKFFKDKDAEPAVGFEDFWKEIEKLGILPEGAIKQLPESLDNMCRAELMKNAIETISILL